MSDKPSFFTELKRRNVYKVAVAYAVVAWLLIQAASILFPTFEAPPWVMKIFVAVILLGLPLALILSWAFEITPEGIKREENISPNESIRHKTGRKLVRITIALAVIAAGLLAFQFLRPKIARTAGAAATPAPLTAPVAGNAVDQKSVAVLAFANLSEEKGNESFADSVSEELLNVLGKVRGLKVTARTSAFHFKGKDTPVPEIARQLGVAYVVEGSVRRSGEKVRIAAQLIKAADGFQVWSDDFNRNLKDVFAVQEEIAGLIAKNLELKLGIKKNQTAPNPEAYQLYLEAVRLWGMRNEASLDRAEQLLQRAITLQPDFARADAAMGFVLSVRSVELGKDPMTGEGRALNEQALQWAERALALDPDLAEGYAAKGNVLENLGRWTECKEAYRRSIELDPNFATAHQWYARNLSEEGYIDEAMVEMKREVELDPLAPRILDNYGGYLTWLGKYPEALEIFDQVLAIQPGSPQALCFKGMALVKAGRADEGRSILETLARQPDQPEWTPVSLAEAFLATGQRREAEALLQHPLKENFYRGLLLCALGRGEEAVPLLKPVVSIYRDMILWTFQEVMPRQSPEFHRKLAEWGMTESWQRAEAWREKNLPKKAP
jgi:TolB-like protein/Tfp pilus assembly protein PilF